MEFFLSLEDTRKNRRNSRVPASSGALAGGKLFVDIIKEQRITQKIADCGIGKRVDYNVC